MAAAQLESAACHSAHLRQHSMASAPAASRHWDIGIGWDGRVVEDGGAVAVASARHSSAPERIAFAAATARSALRSGGWRAAWERATSTSDAAAAAVVRRGTLPAPAAGVACFAACCWGKGNRIPAGECPRCHPCSAPSGPLERHNSAVQ